MIQKLNAVLGFFTFFLALLLFALGMAWITLHSAGRVENNPWAYFCVALFFAPMLHLTAKRYIEALRIRSASVRIGNNVWTAIASFRTVTHVIKTGVVIFIVGFFGGWFWGELKDQCVRGELQVSTLTYAYAAGYLAYFGVVVPVFWFCRGRLRANPGLECSLGEDRLIFSMSNRRFDIELGQLVEIRVLRDYGEGFAFYQRNIASNVPMVTQSPFETTKWLSGKADRPRVFIWHPCSGQASVFLRTAEVYLFAPVRTESVELLEALEQAPVRG